MAAAFISLGSCWRRRMYGPGMFVCVHLADQNSFGATGETLACVWLLDGQLSQEWCLHDQWDSQYDLHHLRSGRRRSHGNAWIPMLLAFSGSSVSKHRRTNPSIYWWLQCILEGCAYWNQAQEGGGLYSGPLADGGICILLPSWRERDCERFDAS